MPDDSTILPRRKLNRNAARPMRLEQRLMFDGAAVDTAAQVVTETVTEPVVMETLTPPAIAEPTPARQELAFVDTNLADWQTLAGQLGDQVEIVLLDTQRDGLSQITEALAGRSEIDALHILSHGDSGRFSLGDIKVDGATLETRSREIQSWSEHLSADADILLYGCNVAAGQAGVDFVEQLSNLTGAEVAASTDSVGMTVAGPSWSLEWNTGSIEAAALAPLQYSYELVASPTLSMTTWNVIGLDSNNVNAGPNEYMVGIRVKANGDALTNYSVKLVADASATIFGQLVTASPYIHIDGKSSYTDVDIAAGTYQDFYFNVSVDRNAAAYDTMLPFHFEVFEDPNFDGVSANPADTATNFKLDKFSWIPNTVQPQVKDTPLYFYVEHLISQARNTISNQTGATGDSPIRVYNSTDSTGLYTGGTLNGPLVLFEGQQIDIRTEGATATGGYPQLTFSTVLDSNIFTISKINEYYNVPVTTLTYQQGFGSGAFTELSSTPFDFIGDANVNTYDKTTGTANTTLYANPAGWNPYLHDLMITSAPPKAGGGPIVSDIQMTITGTGSGALSTLILDYSGSSFHYNADAGTGVNFVPFMAVNGAIVGSVKADINLDNSGDNGIQNITVTLKDSYGNTVATTQTDSNGNYYFKGLLPGTYTVVEGTTAGYLDVRDTDGDSNGKNQVSVTIGNNVLTATGSTLGIADNPATTNVNEATALYGYQRADFVERAGTPVPEKADLSLTKTVDVASADVGDTVVFTLKVVNNGSGTTDNVVIRDKLFGTSGSTGSVDANGVPIQFNGTAPTITASQGSFSTTTGLWTIGTLAWGESATLTIRATMDADFTANLTNTAEITSSSLADPDSTVNNGVTTEDDYASVTVTKTTTVRLDVATNMSASITDASNVAKSINAALVSGDKVTLTVNALNQGGAIGKPYMFVQIPTGLNLTNISAASTSGTTGTIIEYTTNTSGTFTWTTWNNSTPVTGVTYLRYKVLNDGTNFLANATETLTIQGTVNASGATTGYISSSTWWTDMTNGASDNDVDSAVTNQIADPTNNDLNVDDGAGNYTADGKIDDDEATLLIGSAASQTVKLSLDKAISVDVGQSWDADDSVTGLRVGQLVMFKVTLTNDVTASYAASGIEVADVLPGGLSFVSAYGDGSYNKTTGVWSVSQIAKGGSATLYMVAEINGNITNTATISKLDQTNVTTGPTSDSVDATVTGNLADLSLDKTISAGPSWDANGYYTVTFKVSVSNAAGGVNATNVIVKDALPSGLVYLSHSSATGSFDPTTGQWSIASLAAGGSADLYITARITKSSSITNRAEVVALDQIDPDSTPNNSSTNEDDDASAIVDVSLIDLSLAKSATTTTTPISYKDGTDGGGNTQNENAGTYVVYQLTVSNALGFDDASGVKVAETLPAGIDLSTLKYSTDGTNYSSSLSVYDSVNKVWNVDNLAAGTSQTIYIRALVTNLSKLENVAQVSAATQQDVDSTPDNKDSKPYEDDTARATPTNLALITGKVMEDSASGDTGDFDSNDTPISGVTINLYAADGTTLIATTTTDATGAYYFFVPAGTYIIKETNKTGYNDVLAADGVDPATGLAIPSTAADSGSHLAAANNNEIKLTVSGGNEYYGRNFLDDAAVALGSISGKVMLDADKDYPTEAWGDGADTNMAGVTIQLKDSGGNVVATTTTATDGTYSFTNLLPGNYTVLQILPAEHIAVWDSTGSATDAIAAVTVNGDSKTANFLDQRPEADLNVVKTFEGTDGNNVIFKIVVTNQGSSAATGVKVTDLLPGGLSFVGASTNGSNYELASNDLGSDGLFNGYKLSDGTWSIGNLAINGTATLYIKATVTDDTDMTNTATVDGDQYDNDNTDNSDNATPDQPPIATDDTDTYTPGVPKTMDIVTNDITGDPVVPTSVVFTSGSAINGGKELIVPGQGTWTINPTTGAITFTPEAGYKGSPTTVEYKVADAQGNYDTATVTLTPLPIATDDTDTYTPGSPKTVNALNNDNGGDTVIPSTLRFNSNNGTSLVVAGEGIWTINTATGDITFTPEPGFTGNPTPVVYKVADAQGNYDTATVSLTALPPDEPPPVEPPVEPPAPPAPPIPEPTPAPEPVAPPQAIPEPPTPEAAGFGRDGIDTPPEVPVTRGFPVRIEDNTGPRIEHELRVDKAIPDQLFRENQAILYVVPVDAFVHTDAKAQVELTAKMVDGTDIPNWLSFDAKKGEFKGIPPEGFRGKLLIKVIARDDAGRTAETIIRINVGEGLDQISMRGKPAFTEQLKSGGVFAWKAERDKLVKNARDARAKIAKAA